MIADNRFGSLRHSMQHHTKQFLTPSMSTKATKATLSRRGVTLIEVVTAVVVLGIIGASSLPVIIGVSETYAQSTRNRASFERAAYAMDRIVRFIREIPSGPAQGTVAITSAGTNTLRLTNTSAIQLNGTDLLLVTASGQSAVLVRNVDNLQFTYLSNTGVTSSASLPATTQRINVSLTVEGVELNVTALIRSRLTEP